MHEDEFTFVAIGVQASSDLGGGDLLAWKNYLVPEYNKEKKMKRKEKNKQAFMILASSTTVPIPEVDFWNLAHSITVYSM